MRYSTAERYGFTILSIDEDLGGNTDLDELKGIVKTLLDNGLKNLAIKFTENTYFCSLTISVIVQFLGFVKEREGEFVIVGANDRIENTLTIVGLHKLIKMVKFEEELIATL